MRTFTLSLLALAFGLVSKAQTVATFDDLQLSQTDTFYINMSMPGMDMGFNDGLAYFPCQIDTGFGTYYQDYGFVYSNMTDSVTSGYGNQYSAKAGTGYNSHNYAVAYYADNFLKLTGAAVGKNVNGFYTTNNTYAYNSMRDGDQFAKKFTNADKDWFKMTVYGYQNGQRKADSVDFYLADFRFADSTQDYIVRNWTWVDLTSLGHVDSLEFMLTSSDTGSFGMNTPAYFCMDNFTTNETSVGVNNVANANAVKVYPNPATDVLYVSSSNSNVQQVVVRDAAGRTVGTYSMNGDQLAIPTAALPAGMYLLQLSNSNGQNATVRFVKQ